MTRKEFLRSKKTPIFLILVIAAVVISAVLSPASSVSANPCAQCHPTYYEYLDIREGDTRNQLPTSIKVGENKTVTVFVQNLANTVSNAVMSSPSLTLRSKNGHFSVTQETVDAPGLFQWGRTTNASWQITGVSAGADALLISATAINVHVSSRFSDAYSPAPTINVTESAVPEFPSLIVLSLLLLATTLLAVFFKKRSA